jgi:hypothetical protein
VILLEAQGAEDAQRQLATLPPVTLGETSLDVTELAPAQQPRIAEHPRCTLHPASCDTPGDRLPMSAS